MQGYLYKKDSAWTGYWKMLLDKDDWEASFYVLTNVGLLVFETDNFLNPTKLIPLA